MRHGLSRIRIFCTLGIITICAGCSTIYNRLTIDREGHVDLSGSGSAGVATIRGTTFDIGVASTDCWMKYPANAKRVTLDAGMVDIIALCRHTDKSGGSPLDTATFRFEAIAGHKYEISSQKCYQCFRLRDATTNELVAENPAEPASYYREDKTYRYAGRAGINEDLSTGDDTVRLIGLSECRLQGHEVKSLVVDAGSINIDVNCRKPNLTTPSYGTFRSSFAFDAETGHTYYFWQVSHEECIGLFDTTVANSPISCEPYEDVE